MTTAQPGQLTKEMLDTNDYPRVAFYLSAFAAIIMLIAGLFAIFFDSIYFAVLLNAMAGLTVFILGIMLVICALFVGGGAAALVTRPGMRGSAAATIIIFSLLALLVGGGWLVGGVLGIVGGILALMWRPHRAETAAV
jgi:hypothetical protein